jgi:dipeptidyl aminopeptidase/acylaminoacyl peptidase
MLCRIALALLALPLVAQTPLERFIPPSFPWELSAAPKKDRVAWVVSANGAWNIWVAEGPGWVGHALTRYEKADGQEITELAWTADGEAILYTRGGSANRSGEVPNPSSDPKGAEQSVWMAPFRGDAPMKLGDGHSPLAAPSGKLVVWLRGAQVWSAPVDGSQKAAVLFRARGSAGELAFSPDGRMLAFSSQRGDHAFIGVYDTEKQTLSWIDPSTDRDALPAWSPDGKQLAWVRTVSERQAAPFGARREASPWSIRAAEIATGEARELFRADPGTGSVFQRVFSGPSLIWSSAGLVVFPWEKTGWKLLYAVPATGGAARLLTPGAFEVESVALSGGGASLIVSSNQGDIDRRHLWRITLAGGVAQALTPGQGIEWNPAPLASGAIAMIRSDARRPAHAALLDQGAIKELAPALIPTAFPSAELVEPQPLKFSATDGMEIPAQLFLPRDLKPGEKRPAVVFFHGGSRRQMLLGWHPMYYYHNSYGFNQYLVSRGYIVLSVNYRSGIGYGMEFREALDYGASGASEYNDVAGAGLYLRGRPDVDPARIGLWGGSYGGYLTALGLARASDLFAAGVDFHGVHEWVRDIQDTRPDAARMREEFQRTAWESSPMSSVDHWRSPVLLIHGDDDRNVLFNQTVQLVEELRKRKVDLETLVFPDEVHDFLLAESWLRAYRASAGFLDRKLKASASSR